MHPDHLCRSTPSARPSAIRMIRLRSSTSVPVVPTYEMTAAVQASDKMH